MARPWTPPPGWVNPNPGCSWFFQYHYPSACWIHDWQYRHVGRLPMLTARQTRKQADSELFHRMVYLNRVHRRRSWRNFAEWLVRWWWRPWAWWLGLRLFGWRHWQNPPLTHQEEPRP